MPKMKTNRGLMKRIRITKSGKVKFKRAFGRHLKSHKPGKTIRSYRSPSYATAGDIKRLQPIVSRKIVPHVKEPGEGLGHISDRPAKKEKPAPAADSKD